MASKRERDHRSGEEDERPFNRAATTASAAASDAIARVQAPQPPRSLAQALHADELNLIIQNLDTLGMLSVARTSHGMLHAMRHPHAHIGRVLEVTVGGSYVNGYSFATTRGEFPDLTANPLLNQIKMIRGNYGTKDPYDRPHSRDRDYVFVEHGSAYNITARRVTKQFIQYMPNFTHLQFGSFNEFLHHLGEIHRERERMSVEDVPDVETSEQLLDTYLPQQLHRLQSLSFITGVETYLDVFVQRAPNLKEIRMFTAMYGDFEGEGIWFQKASILDYAYKCSVPAMDALIPVLHRDIRHALACTTFEWANVNTPFYNSKDEGIRAMFTLQQIPVLVDAIQATALTKIILHGILFTPAALLSLRSQLGERTQVVLDPGFVFPAGRGEDIIDQFKANDETELDFIKEAPFVKIVKSQ